LIDFILYVFYRKGAEAQYVFIFFILGVSASWRLILFSPRRRKGAEARCVFIFFILGVLAVDFIFTAESQGRKGTVCFFLYSSRLRVLAVNSFRILSKIQIKKEPLFTAKAQRRSFFPYSWRLRVLAVDFLFVFFQSYK
jgi:hypothetical protein